MENVTPVMNGYQRVHIESLTMFAMCTKSFSCHKLLTGVAINVANLEQPHATSHAAPVRFSFIAHISSHMQKHTIIRVYKFRSL